MGSSPSRANLDEGSARPVAPYPPVIRPDERSEESATGRGTECRRVMEDERLLESRRLVVQFISPFDWVYVCRGLDFMSIYVSKYSVCRIRFY